MGYLVAVLVVAVPTLFAVAAPRRKPLLAALSFWLGLAINEAPLYPGVALAGATALALADGTARTVPGLVGLGLAVPTAVGLGVLVRRGLAARGVLAAALDDAGLGDAADRVRKAGSAWRDVGALLAPVVLTGRGLGRREVVYGPHGARNLADVYRRRGDGPAPVVVYLHGGSYARGRKDREGALLVQRLARSGWVAVSATYRFRPAAGMVEHLADLEAVLGWVAAHAAELGADPERVVLAGSSAGAHLAAVGALRGDSRAARAAAVVGLYGYYGHYWGGGAADRASTSPAELAGPGAPPFVLVHGSADTVVPPAAARSLAARLRRVSRAPVVHAELPGAQHGFDLLRSPRMLAVVDAVEAILIPVVGWDYLLDTRG